MIKRIIMIMLIVTLVLLSGCSFKRIIVDSTGVIMDDVVGAFFEEEDMQFVKEAIPANLKLLDGLIRGSDSENYDLLIKGCKLYSMYAVSFLEDATADKKQDKKNLKRAKIFYKKAKKYGLKTLTRNKDFENVLNAHVDDFRKMMIAFNKSDVEELFWTAFAWGSYINLDRSSPRSIADLPKVKAMVERVIELDPSYFYGIPHVFMIVNYSMPKMFGGDLEKAMAEYKTIKEVSDDKFVLADFYMAKYYAVQAQDKALFEELLEKVGDADDDVIPELLITAVAKSKAEVLSKRMNDLF